MVLPSCPLIQNSISYEVEELEDMHVATHDKPFNIVNSDLLGASLRFRAYHSRNLVASFQSSIIPLASARVVLSASITRTLSPN